MRKSQDQGTLFLPPHRPATERAKRRGFFRRIGNFFGRIFDFVFSESALYSMGALISIVVLGFIIFAFFNMAASAQSLRDSIAEERSKLNSAESAPVAAIDPTPAASFDLSGVWPILGLIAAGLGIIGLGAGVFWLLKRGHHSSLASKREQAAIEEDRRRALAVWEGFTDRHDALKAKALKIETDWDLLFSYPALVDASVPQTRALHRALRDLDAASSTAPQGISLSMEIGSLPYPKLVAEAEAAWDAAWSFAKRTGLKLIPRAERKKVDQIVKLLKLARNGGSSEHERSLAYDRAAKLIGELQFVKVPEVAMQSISRKIQTMLEAPVAAESRLEPIQERVPVAL